MAELGEANIGGRMVPAWILNGNASAIDFFESADYPGCIYRKLADGTVEWVNPPMAIGVEYRTIERYSGKPVYAQIVNFGTLPNVSTKRLNHNIQNISSAIAVYGQSQDQALTVGAFSGGITAINADNTQIVITTSQNLSAYGAYVAVKYTKTTD